MPNRPDSLGMASVAFTPAVSQLSVPNKWLTVTDSAGPSMHPHVLVSRVRTPSVGKFAEKILVLV